MTVRKEKWGWIVDFVFTHPDGSQERVRRKSAVHTKRGAEEYERQIRQEMLNPQPIRKEVPTLSEFAEEFINTYATSNNAPSEVDSKKGHLRLYLEPDLGDRRLDKITVRDVEKLKASLLKRGLSPKTVNNALGTLSRLLSFSKQAEVITTMVTIKRLKAPLPAFELLTFEETDRLLHAAGKFSADWYAQVLVAVRTGLRYGELCELRWPDLDLVAARLLVRRSFSKGHVGPPKSGKDREVPLSPETVAVLKAHRHLRSELVFCKPDGGRRIHRRADVAIKKICKRAGLRDIGWHVLRHPFASHLVMRGVPLKAVQELLGHSTIAMTMRYAHLSPTVKQEAVALLDSGNSWQQGGSKENARREPGVF